MFLRLSVSSQIGEGSAYRGGLPPGVCIGGVCLQGGGLPLEGEGGSASRWGLPPVVEGGSASQGRGLPLGGSASRGVGQTSH